MQLLSLAERYLDRWLLIVLLLVAAGLGGWWFLGMLEDGAFPDPDEALTVASSTPLQPSGPVLTEAVPTRLRIPEAGIDTTFERPLGLNADNTVEVPDSYEEVGWYEYGPTPGELGPAVILGHVDSYEGPAVFYSLSQLEEGDEILVDREDGTTARFVVSALEQASQDEFPTARVYGDIDHAGLRLITCSGTYDQGTLRYSHNLIVYARLVTSTESSGG